MTGTFNSFARAFRPADISATSRSRLLAACLDVGPMTTTESTEYDNLGRTIATTDVLGRVTRTEYSEDGLTTTVTTPAGATLVTKTYYDGTVILEGGTGQREMETRLELTSEGILTTTLSKGIVLLRSLENGFGQTVRQEQPNTKGGFIVTSNTYNAKGQPVRSQTEDMASTVTVYNELGHAVRRTVQLDDLHPDDPSRNRVSENSSCYRLREDGVYQVQTSTTCNADGFPLTQTTENMVSRLSAVLENKSITTDVYGQQSVQWTEYTVPTKRTRFSRIPTSNMVAESLVVDGFGTNQTDHSGICSIQRRSCTSTGVILEKTDGRGNTTMEETDLAGRPVKTTGPAGHVTTTSYSSCCDHPACITDALGGTTCYSYDIRGRKTAEYGTAIQPACFAYDEADRMVALTTFRANEGDITSDPSGRTDGDTTTWLYDEATGLELKKTYADGSCVSRTYDELNRQETLVKARGLVITYKYAPFTGELISVSYSDGTSPWIFSSNHLGQIISVYDASGLREFSYDSYGRMIQDTSFGQVESSLQEEYDAQGRSNGYRLMLGTRTVQHSHLDYDSKGGMIGMNLEGLKSSFTWRYDQTTGFLHHLTYPNGMVRCNTYHPTLNLVTAIGYRKGADGELAAGHEYDYDALMRPTQRRDSWDAATPATIRDFTYNKRSELVKDQIRQGGSFNYRYDNIGNRKTVQELEEEVSYAANSLNQYMDMTVNEVSFTPTYDADGNQTRIRTSTGIWEISYDANDRPVVFTSQDGRTAITCGYDYQGRRFEKKVTVNGTISSHCWYLYRGYLQVAELDLMHPEPLLVKSYLWDPTEPTATRVLMLTNWKNGGTTIDQHLCFMHDALKNVTSIFDDYQTRRARYEYAPFGRLIVAERNMAQESRFRFSCEYMDDELGLVYYNYRHLNPTDGRWINRDPIQEQGGWNLYAFIRNRINIEVDLLGKIPPYNGGASGIVEVPIFPPAPTPPAPTPPAPTPPQEGCSIQICCRPVAVFSRAHCVIRFVSSSGPSRGCRGGPTGRGKSSGAGGSSGSSGSGNGNGQSSHCKGCCGSWGNVIGGCGSISNGTDPLSVGITEDLNDAESNPDRCETVAIVSERMCSIAYSCIQKEMEKINQECYIYKPLGNNSNTTWKTAYRNCIGGDYDPPESQPGNDEFDENEKCKK